MRKKENAFIGFVKKTIIPFITVLVISLVSILIYKGITEVTNDKLIIVAVMIATIIMLSSLFISGDLIRRKLTEKPLRELLDATEKIARGDFSVRLEMDHPYGKFSGYDLVKDNINAMVLALNKSETLNTDFISNVSPTLWPITPSSNPSIYVPDPNVNCWSFAVPPLKATPFNFPT